jgi:hypothetical protein
VGVVVGVVVVALIAAVVVLLLWRRKQRPENEAKGSEEMANVDLHTYAPMASPSGSKESLGMLTAAQILCSLLFCRRSKQLLWDPLGWTQRLFYAFK